MEKTTQNSYHTHISSKHNALELKLDEVWRYRDLILLFTKRNFVVRYKQTILGPAWILLNPLCSSIIYAIVFGGIAKIGTEGIPTILFYLCSNAIWLFFATCVTTNARTFTENANVFGKVYFPRLTMPISNMLSAGIHFCVQMLMVMGFLGFYLVQGAVHPNWAAWLLIPVVLYGSLKKNTMRKSWESARIWETMVRNDTGIGNCFATGSGLWRPMHLGCVMSTW